MMLNLGQAAVGAFLGVMETNPPRFSVAYRVWMELSAQDRLLTEELHYGGARYLFPRAAWHFEVVWQRRHESRGGQGA